MNSNEKYRKQKLRMKTKLEILCTYMYWDIEIIFVKCKNCGKEIIFGNHINIPEQKQ